MLVISSKVTLLLFAAYRCKILSYLSVIEGFIRICFQITIYIFEDSGDMHEFLNKEVHLKIILTFFFLWALNLIFSIIEVLK